VLRLPNKCHIYGPIANLSRDLTSFLSLRASANRRPHMDPVLKMALEGILAYVITLSEARVINNFVLL